MEITVNIRLASSKESDYTFNVDLDSEGRFNNTPQLSRKELRNSDLGGVQRPSANKLNLIRNPKLREEEEATTEVMDSIALDE